ncbi:KOW domain-containing RNA-binding protein [Clostridium sp. CX1]|uniref:KOW domain-containing RNA-binding protein n=1 Tax=Clostridium sp. CX1 TaxID=2978346 RepID=UPI0021C0A4AC|nr:KOW domain-containing RNA-binding protein [Clostridium sp. CX1]MCT8976487.1 KOW domain-containing RNA-binding protein [Clostridium sp. CX1]
MNILLDSNNYLGRIVYSKAGRDKDKFFIILGVLDKEYVHVADGVLRTVNRQKKKKVKHLGFTSVMADEIKNLLLSGEQVTDAMIREILQSYDNNKEV